MTNVNATYGYNEELPLLDLAVCLLTTR